MYIYLVYSGESQFTSFERGSATTSACHHRDLVFLGFALHYQRHDCLFHCKSDLVSKQELLCRYKVTCPP